MTPTLALVPALLLAAVPTAQAQSNWADRLSFSGFGTVGLVQTNSNEGEYRREQQKDGATKSATALVDSNLGLQVDFKANDWLSATVQTLTTQRTTGGMSSRFEWAFVKAQVAEGVTLRGGKLNLPNFLVSDSRRIGYANTTLRPSDEVYGLDILNGGLTGGEGAWRFRVGGGSLTVSALAGTSVYDDVDSPSTDVKSVQGANVVWDGDWYQVRLGYVQAKPQLQKLASILEPQLPPGKKLSDEQYSFSGIGLSAERDNVLLQTEYVTRHSSLFQGVVGGQAWYVLGGYRMDRVLPYLQWSERKQEKSYSTYTFPQTTLAAGVRWDAFAKAAIKVQLEHINTDQTAGASFQTDRVMTAYGPAPMPVKHPVNALSVALDFVF